MNTLKAKLLESPKNLLTAIVAAGWGVSFLVRIWKPEYTLGAAFDSVSSTVMGYWFTTSKPEGEQQ